MKLKIHNNCWHSFEGRMSLCGHAALRPESPREAAAPECAASLVAASPRLTQYDLAQQALSNPAADTHMSYYENKGWRRFMSPHPLDPKQQGLLAGPRRSAEPPLHSHEHLRRTMALLCLLFGPWLEPTHMALPPLPFICNCTVYFPDYSGYARSLYKPKLQRESQIAYSNNNQRYLQFRLSYFINTYTLFYSRFSHF